MAEWVNVFGRAVLDTKAEGLNVELQSTGWHLFEKEQSDPGATRTCVRGPLKANTSSLPFEGL